MQIGYILVYNSNIFNLFKRSDKMKESLSKFCSMIIATTMLVSTPTYIFANENTGINKTNNLIVNSKEYNTAEFIGKASRAPWDSYTVTSSKDVRNTSCNGGDGYVNGVHFQCYGWVNIVDKKSGTDLDHSTTASISDPHYPDKILGAIRNTGSGKVDATSAWVHGYSLGRIFWDWTI